MFTDIKVPFNSVMLYNVAKLKDGMTISDVEEHIGTMCNIVKKSTVTANCISVKSGMRLN